MVVRKRRCETCRWWTPTEHWGIWDKPGWGECGKVDASDGGIQLMERWVSGEASVAVLMCRTFSCMLWEAKDG